MARKRRSRRPPVLDEPQKPGMSAEGQALWDKVAETVTPLTRRDGINPKPLSALRVRPRTDRAPGGGTSPPPPSQPSAPQPLDRRTRKQLARDRLDIDRRIDLHGLTQARAYQLITQTVKAAYAAQDRYLLIVTGKGGRRFTQTSRHDHATYRMRSDFHLEGGVLKRMLPEWLSSDVLAPFVSGFGPADPSHGGSGALYVRIRRRR